MKIEIVERLSSITTKHVKIQCANGDTIRLDIQEVENDVKILVTSVDTYPAVQPKTANQILINFID